MACVHGAQSGGDCPQCLAGPMAVPFVPPDRLGHGSHYGLEGLLKGGTYRFMAWVLPDGSQKTAVQGGRLTYVPDWGDNGHIDLIHADGKIVASVHEGDNEHRLDLPVGTYRLVAVGVKGMWDALVTH